MHLSNLCFLFESFKNKGKLYTLALLLVYILCYRVYSSFLAVTADDQCSSGESQLISLPLKVNTFPQFSHFLSAHYDLAPRHTVSSAVPNREPLLATPGACEATHILPAAQDGDLAISHFHWKTTASGYHRCQQGARGVALAMMLLAAAAAEVGETCFAFIFCLALWLAGYETLLYHLAEPLHYRPKPNTVCYVYTFRLRFIPPP